jgi:uncharacterized glyoxalase superfamily protein PhnB/predicted enzyme related to lactoylglutathione lyase
VSEHRPPIDPFEALVVDTTPIAPSARFADSLRQQIVTELETPMSPATSPAAIPATTTDPLTVTNTVTPYLCVDGAAAAIDFYVAAFGAVEHHRMVGDDGRIGHAEIVIGGSRLMLADEYPEVGVLSPTTRGGSSTNFTLEVPDVDRAFARALELGARELRAVADQFYGFRQGTLVDPFGHQWSLSTPIAGYGDDEYVERSAAEGYDVQRPAGASTTVATGVDDEPDDHQVKHHGRGDLYYFTLPTTDIERAQTFFGAVLGWRFESPDNGHVRNISAPPGGLNQGADTAARLWFVVDDIHAAVATVREMGGTADEPVLYASGWSADCTDDQGTEFSLSVPSATHTR